MLNRTVFLALGLLLLFACARPLTPLQQISSDIDSVKLACESACAAPNTHFAVNLTVPPNATAYFTDEALCVKAGDRLFCARCPCGIAPAANLTPGKYSCSFSANGTLLVACGQ